MRRDVYSVKDAMGFWCHFSETDSGEWRLEYEPVYRYDPAGLVEIGPFGVRARLPLEAVPPRERVLASVLTPGADADREVRMLAALIDAHSLPLGAVEERIELPVAHQENVLYEVLDDGVGSGQLGMVEVYESGKIFRFETGDEVPLDLLSDRLWPFGGSIGPHD